jgi:Predicted choline kinase involved in LPS biosynthesis
MAILVLVSNAQECQVVLLLHGSRTALALAASEGPLLPLVSIPANSRTAQELQKAIQNRWGVTAFILEICPGPDGATPCAIAEISSTKIPTGLEVVDLDQIPDSQLTAEQRRMCEELLNGNPMAPISRIGWVNEALNWVESATKRSFSIQNAEQLNAGGGFILLRVRSDDGADYWLKAAGAPNEHELSITSCLSRLYPEFLPNVIAIREDWNAWLAESAGEPVADSPAGVALAEAARIFSSLQLQTTGDIDMLLRAGAFDHRIAALRNRLDEIVVFLTNAMERQTTTKVEPLGRRRIAELGEVLRGALCQMERLDIPDALLHNDLNAGNILWDGARYAFTDWSEAAVGNPFLSFERFRLVNLGAEAELRREYKETWRERVSETRIERAFDLAPLLSIYTCLYGRGDWLEHLNTATPKFESYARSLARHMDRAAQRPQLQEALCH